MGKQVEISDSLAPRIENHLSQHGGGNMTDYVNKAVKAQLFWDTVEALQKRNANVDPSLLEAEACRPGTVRPGDFGTP
jgi:hypothetical protein